LSLSLKAVSVSSDASGDRSHLSVREVADAPERASLRSEKAA
jgi:hypothetical protein